MIKQVIFPKVAMSDEFDNLRLVVDKSIYSSDKDFSEILSSLPIQTAAREIGQFDLRSGPYAFLEKVNGNGNFYYMGYVFYLNTTIDPNMTCGELQIFLANAVSAKIEELTVEDIPDPVSRASDRGRSFVVNHSWAQDTHWGGRTTVFDYQLVDGTYRPIGSRVVVTQFSEHEAGRHWEEVRRQSPFELDLLCLDATFEVNGFCEYTFEVLSHQLVNPKRPKRVSGYRNTYTLGYFETASDALINDLRDVFVCCHAVPVVKIPEATLKTLDEGY